MKRGCVVALVAGGIAVLVPFLGYQVNGYRQRGELENELRLARAEGIPTTADEFAATLPVIPNAENAALDYQRMPMLHYTNSGDLLGLLVDLNYKRNPVIEKKAANALHDGKSLVSLADHATTLPHCGFQRDWRLGAAILMPELADIKTAARLLLIRGALSAPSSPTHALSEAEKVQKMAAHLREQPGVINGLVASSLDTMVLNELAVWSYNFSDHKQYLAALKQAIEDLPMPNLKKEHRFDLVEMQSLIELCSTARGQAELGLKPDDLDVGPGKVIFPLLQPPAVGERRIVKGMREYWKALDLPQPKMEKSTEDARFEMYQGLMSFPIAVKVYGMLSGDDDDNAEGLRLDTFRAKKVGYQALVRALSSRPIPTSIETTDLISPYDGKPIRYRYDGKQIVVDTGKTVIKIPPDSVFGKK
jgi:hypothetical protein